MATQEASTERRGREGGRWINERPSSEEFGEWFRENMKIDEALKPEDYVGGIVLIPAVDSKAKHVTGFRNGKPVIEEREELSFIPYAKVETRIAYFWDLLDARRTEWVGVVERITPPRLDVEETLLKSTTTTREDDSQETTEEYGRPGAMAQMVHQLPEGFSVMSVPVGDKFSFFLCCTIRVAIYNRDEYTADPKKAVPIRVGQGTKQVPLTKRGYQNSTYADDSSLMKAETGALGRALGFAGIFVIPGSGVATAEDMLEAAAQGATPTSDDGDVNQGPAAPAEGAVKTGAEQAEDDETQLRQRAAALFRELSEDYPEVAQRDFGAWARQRQLRNLGEAKGAMLRGVVKKLEKLLDEAKTRQEGEADVPSEAPETAADDAEEGTGGADGAEEPSGQTG